MNRNLKGFGLVLIAAFALSAVAASAAVAQQGTMTSDGPVTGFATETGEASANRLTAFGTAIECPGSTYTVHKFNETPHKFMPSGSLISTVTPHFKQSNHNCKGPFGWPMTVDMNGCDYVGHLGETTGGVNGTYAGKLDVVCPAGQEITVTFFTNTTDETNGKVSCILHIKAQTNLVGAHATDKGNGHVAIEGTFEGIHVTRTSSGHTILCAAEETTATAKLDIDITVEGRNAEGAKTALSYSHP